MKERIIEKIKYVPPYGNILFKESNPFDDKKLIKKGDLYQYFDDNKFIKKENLYQYRLSKISIFKGENNSILGIQSFYTNMKKEEIPGEKCLKDPINILETINFEIPANDFLSNMNLNVGNDSITKIKFETQKGKVLEVGEGGDYKKISCLNKTKDNIILVLCGGYANLLQSLGCKYINKSEYFGNVYGYFELRKKLKDENYKKGINSNLEKYDDINKILLSVCLLPESCFNEVISFCVR